MALWGRIGWLFVGAVCVATIAGCGSASTGRVSSDAVITTVRDFAGPDAKVYRSQVLIQQADDGSMRWMPMVVACRPEGGCEVVAPDGAGYADLQAFVDDTQLLKPGDKVLGAANITSPGEPVRAATFTKGASLPWVWYAGGGALLVLLLAAVWLMVRARRRRRADERLLRTWEISQDDE